GVFAALTWYLVAVPALSAAHAEPLTHLYTVAVDVDAQGHVAGTKPAADTPAPIAVVLDQALKQWRFAPVMQEGHAASVHSYLVADVQALPAEAGKYGVRVGYVGVGQLPEASGREGSGLSSAGIAGAHRGWPIAGRCRDCRRSHTAARGQTGNHGCPRHDPRRIEHAREIDLD